MSYCEIPEFYDESFPKAKKTHRCIECPAPIEKGEKHLCYRGKWDGDFTMGRQHLLCRDLCMALRGNDIDECVPFGNLFEEWREFQASDPDARSRWDEKDKTHRNLMAQIKWRSRKHRTLRKRTNGVLMNRRWGSAWEVIQE